VSDTDAPDWVPFAVVRAIHDRQISRHGGMPGLRDAALLEMGCARPMNLWAYGAPDLHDLAGAYAFGISKAHAFVDGNKRTALATALTFLRINDAGLIPHQPTAVAMIEALAQDTVPESEFARWLRGGAGG
jgi:death-on-curing protein